MGPLSVVKGSRFDDPDDVGGRVAERRCMVALSGSFGKTFPKFPHDGRKAGMP